MGKVIMGLFAVGAIWLGVELFQNGSSGAFGGVFAKDAGLAGTPSPEPRRNTVQRSSDAVVRAHDEAAARRERMLRD